MTEGALKNCVLDPVRDDRGKEVTMHLCFFVRRRGLALPTWILTAAIVTSGMLLSTSAHGRSLDDVKKAGVLRHLGIPYANFVTGAGDGMDVELMQRFAERMGVKYEYVHTDWGTIFGDLTGRKITVDGSDAVAGDSVPVRGDVAANGITILPWREKVVDFSIPIFPNQVWLMARADSPASPIKPTGDIHKDMEATRSVLAHKTLLSKPGTCLDYSLYDVKTADVEVRIFSGGLNEMAPALLNRDADLSLLDVPDALVALGKWPGQLKVIGPFSLPQGMGVAFAKDSPQLRDAFNAFLRESIKDGSFTPLVRKYYPYVLDYYPDFFKGLEVTH